MAPAISLGSYGYRIRMKFSLAAQPGLPQLLPALPFSLFSSREQLGGVAIKIPFPVSPSVPAAALPTLLCIPRLWPLDHLHSRCSLAKKKKPQKCIWSTSFVHIKPMVSVLGSERAHLIFTTSEVTFPHNKW